MNYTKFQRVFVALTEGKMRVILTGDAAIDAEKGMTMDAGNDILIRLYGAEDHSADLAALRERGVAIKLAMDVNASEIEAFVRDNFSAIWADEARFALMRSPPARSRAVPSRRTAPSTSQASLRGSRALCCR